MEKPRVAFYWCSSCGGCEETVVDLHEQILDVVDAVDIALWPVALDIKKADVQSWPDQSLAVAFINGAIRLEDQAEWVKLLRRKASLVIAFGSCAHLGGIPGLANATTREEILTNKYLRSPSVDNPKEILPEECCEIDGMELHLPRFWKDVKRLDQVIDVDYYLPGCPPPAESVGETVMALLEDRLPKRGSVLAPEKCLCDECSRKESKPEEFCIETFKRVATSTPDPEKCLLAEGYLCMGPATRSGCGFRCLRANMPCRGCFGPPAGAIDQGVKMLGAVASLGKARDDDSAVALAKSVVDPLGTFYRFGLPSSLLKRTMRG